MLQERNDRWLLVANAEWRRGGGESYVERKELVPASKFWGLRHVEGAEAPAERAQWAEQLRGKWDRFVRKDIAMWMKRLKKREGGRKVAGRSVAGHGGNCASAAAGGWQNASSAPQPRALAGVLGPGAPGAEEE